jgi:hypothetical protein
MKPLICMALVVFTVSVCGAQSTSPAAEPTPSVPGIPNPPPGGTPELPGGPGTIPERRAVPPVPGDASHPSSGSTSHQGSKGEKTDATPPMSESPSKKIK